MTGMLQVTQMHQQWSNPFWTESQNIEMLTRVKMREDVEELFSDQLPGEALDELKDEVFNIIYPTYARRAGQ
jgi:hypothetical protein